MSKGARIGPATLMTSVKGQSTSHVKESWNKAISLKHCHCSLYQLLYPLAGLEPRSINHHSFRPPDYCMPLKGYAMIHIVYHFYHYHTFSLCIQGSFCIVFMEIGGLKAGFATVASMSSSVWPEKGFLGCNQAGSTPTPTMKTLRSCWSKDHSATPNNCKTFFVLMR